MNRFPFRPPYLPLLLCLFLMAPGCDTNDADNPDPEPAPPLLNLDHLDHLGEDVTQGGTAYRLVHIYAEAPDYRWVADDDEGAAALDDAARAAVVYLRHFETTGDAASRDKAMALLRFVMYLQTDDGRFYNFVWDNTLRINTTHPNSRADAFGWWAARGVWALGTCARALKAADPAFSSACADRVRRTFPHLRAALDRYGRTMSLQGRTFPRWLLGENAADATSELLLGLVAFNQAYPDAEVQTMIGRFAEGIAMMQYGAIDTFPYSAHASYSGGWHGWGNSQTQALAEAGLPASAVREAEHFYSRLLVDGWLHSMPFDAPNNPRRYEQIAYAVRCVAVGLLRLREATGDARYAKLAGLAASWLTGNNVAGAVMYDADTGRGYDGINGPDQVNRNAGAESTIEAVFTILEVEQHPEARAWLSARGEPPVHTEKNGKRYAYRLFTAGEGEAAQRLGVVMNLTDARLDLLEGTALDSFLAP